MDKKDAKIIKIAKGLENQFKLENDVLNSPEIHNMNDFHIVLSHLVKAMIEEDFERFLTVMYRMDISEIKLKDALYMDNKDEVYYKIAELIIKREEEKVFWREKYKN